MRIAGKSVEKEISQTMAGEMLGQFHSPGKHKSFRCDPPLLCLALQVRLRQRAKADSDHFEA
jgi:hypothetical protein